MHGVYTLRYALGRNKPHGVTQIVAQIGLKCPCPRATPRCCTTPHRWGKATPGKKGIRWDKVEEKIWKEVGDEEETLDTEGFGGFKKKVKEML
ncbi:unnamed protein product, partial [Ectocarpus sp. 13 AM-2016]